MAPETQLQSRSRASFANLPVEILARILGYCDWDTAKVFVQLSRKAFTSGLPRVRTVARIRGPLVKSSRLCSTILRDPSHLTLSYAKILKVQLMYPSYNNPEVSDLPKVEKVDRFEFMMNTFKPIVQLIVGMHGLEELHLSMPKTFDLNALGHALHAYRLVPASPAPTTFKTLVVNGHHLELLYEIFSHVEAAEFHVRWFDHRSLIPSEELDPLKLSLKSIRLHSLPGRSSDAHVIRKMSTRVPLVEDIVITGNMFRRPIPNDENGPGAWTRRSVKEFADSSFNKSRFKNLRRLAITDCPLGKPQPDLFGEDEEVPDYAPAWNARVLGLSPSQLRQATAELYFDAAPNLVELALFVEDGEILWYRHRGDIGVVEAIPVRPGSQGGHSRWPYKLLDSRNIAKS